MAPCELVASPPIPGGPLGRRHHPQNSAILNRNPGTARCVVRHKLAVRASRTVAARRRPLATRGEFVRQARGPTPKRMAGPGPDRSVQTAERKVLVGRRVPSRLRDVDFWRHKRPGIRDGYACMIDPQVGRRPRRLPLQSSSDTGSGRLGSYRNRNRDTPPYAGDNPPCRRQ